MSKWVEVSCNDWECCVNDHIRLRACIVDPGYPPAGWYWEIVVNSHGDEDRPIHLDCGIAKARGPAKRGARRALQTWKKRFKEAE